jgi:hypothetical protein
MYDIVVTLRFISKGKNQSKKILILQITKATCTIHGHHEIAINNIM